MTLVTTVRAAIKVDLEGSNALANPKFNGPFAAEIKMLSGTTAGKADLVYAAQRTIAASASEDIDLAGALEDPLGQALTVAKLKALMIRAAAANANNVVVGNGTHPILGVFGAGAHTITVGPGDAFVWTSLAGATITATTADDLGVANSAGGSSVTYDIIAIGSSA